MEEVIQILIFNHAFFGGLGLISGIISVIVKKGSSIHKRVGLLFSFSMAVSSLISIYISTLPSHENQFLFLIGIFTIYMVLAGMRALTFKSRLKTKSSWMDWVISGSMLIAALFMFVFGFLEFSVSSSNSLLHFFFGGISLFFTYKDFHLYNNIDYAKKKWLKNHLGRMVGALIASITAFLITALSFKQVFVWILPTLIGLPYIISWNKKITKTYTENSKLV